MRLTLVLIILYSSLAFSQTTRKFADTIGFASKSGQMNKIIERIEKEDTTQKELEQTIIPRLVISPHDDYSYVGSLYTAVLRPVKAKTLFLIGVAHKAKIFGLQDQLIFDDYQNWSGPYGNVKISDLKNYILQNLPEDSYQVHHKMHTIEHSLEALIPFLQFYNKEIQIVPILIPYMDFETMKKLASQLANAIKEATQVHNLKWGTDYAVIVSSDAVHYGDQDWGGKDFAFFGADSAGYKKAIEKEKLIFSDCLQGQISEEKVKAFTHYTVKEEDHKEYKWTWCGRYSVPFGLLTGLYLSKILEMEVPVSKKSAYSTSIDHEHLEVKDLGLGVTAPANIRHWVGYAGVIYE